MPGKHSPHVERSVGRALARVRGPLVLAVSGGVDSMVLLHAAARSRALRRRCTVATFDHGTGPHATRAARLVRATCQAVGLHVVSGRADTLSGTEAAWRAQRWSFLHSVAAKRGATIVTAHTRDDQVETVVMRLLRGASARGLAALYAGSSIVRPLLGVRRAAIERYAAVHGITFVEDPTNSSRAYLRNRVRHELLPAIRAVRPTFEREMLHLSKRAARVRRETERLANRFVVAMQPERVEISANDLDGLSADTLSVLWPPFVARLGVPLDRRGVARAVGFSRSSRPGQEAHCSGGVTLERTPTTILVRRNSSSPPATVELDSTVEFGRWRLSTVSELAFRAHLAVAGTSWGAAIAEMPTSLRVRTWLPGDRVRAKGSSAPRRVKRYFSEHAIPVSERKSWPVIVRAGEVLWVPGICEAAAPIERTGHQLTYMICERRVG